MFLQERKKEHLETLLHSFMIEKLHKAQGNLTSF